MEYENVIRLQELDRRLHRVEMKLDYLIKKWFPEEAEAINADKNEADKLMEGIEDLDIGE
jgi:hypothetical protein